MTPKTPRRIELSRTGGRMGALRWVCIHSVSGRDVSLSGFYLYQFADMILKCFVPSLLNTQTHRNTETHTRKLNRAALWSHSTSYITQTLSDYQLLTLDPFTIDSSLFGKLKRFTLPLLLQSCIRVGFTYDTDSQVCSALFAFQMAHKVFCSSFKMSTWVFFYKKSLCDSLFLLLCPNLLSYQTFGNPFLCNLFLIFYMICPW